ncbi:MAG: Asp23/Gls24 family envelope stress response protein [Enterococcaceae bacterium]|jgi:uncharacterized alkaline shock family protein YloU|nr:Asp23/Gls24 family envelope stress response protein [Enterococcaceae bacterium]
MSNNNYKNMNGTGTVSTKKPVSVETAKKENHLNDLKKKDHTAQVPEKSSTIKGELTFEDKVIQKIIGIAVEKIDGLLTVDGGFFSNFAGKLINTDDPTTGIETEVGKKQVAVDMDVVVEYGRDIPKIADTIRQVIHEQVAKLTHLDVIEVNINVADVKSQADYEKESETVQDKVTNAAKTTGEFASEKTSQAKNKIRCEADKIQEKVQEQKEVRVD